MNDLGYRIGYQLGKLVGPLQTAPTVLWITAVGICLLVYCCGCFLLGVMNSPQSILLGSVATIIC